MSPAAHGSTGLDVSFFPAAGGEATTLRDVRPTVASSNGTSTTVSTLLSSELSRVDIVSSTPSISQALESGVAENLHVFNEAESFAGTIEVKQPSWMKEVASRRGGLSGSKGGGARAPMPSKIVEVKVKAGDRVEAGQLLVVVEAMKMVRSLSVRKKGLPFIVSSTLFISMMVSSSPPGACTESAQSGSGRKGDGAGRRSG